MYVIPAITELSVKRIGIITMQDMPMPLLREDDQKVGKEHGFLKKS